jgi:hypothetical protein
MGGGTAKVRTWLFLVIDAPWSRAYLSFACAVVPDGYGLSYSIGDDYIRWTITSLKLNSDKFKGCLEEAATETRQMMERAKQAENTQTKL